MRRLHRAAGALERSVEGGRAGAAGSPQAAPAAAADHDRRPGRLAVAAVLGGGVMRNPHALGPPTRWRSFSNPAGAGPRGDDIPITNRPIAVATRSRGCLGSDREPDLEWPPHRPGNRPGDHLDRGAPDADQPGGDPGRRLGAQCCPGGRQRLADRPGDQPAGRDHPRRREAVRPGRRGRGGLGLHPAPGTAP